MVSPLPYVLLVGGFKDFSFSISYMGCHPKPIDELILFKMVKTCSNHQPGKYLGIAWYS